MTLCNYTEIESGKWQCTVCHHTVKTSHMPRKQCGVKHVAKVCTKQPQPTQQTLQQSNSNDATLHNFNTCKHRGDKVREQPCKSCQSGTGKPNVDIYACGVLGECTPKGTSIPKEKRPQACSTCDKYEPKIGTKKLHQITLNPSPVSTSADYKIVPGDGGWQAWRGISKPHPKDYNVTAVIPVINADDTLPLVIELLRLQTEKPYIILVDTGSKDTTFVESLRASDVEIHYIRKHGNIHLAECVSQACDIGVALALTRFVFFTHADCFLRKRTALSELVSLASRHGVAGHQITERDYTDWQLEFGHTFLMVDQWRIDDAGITWKMQRGVRTPGAVPPDKVADYSAELLLPLAHIVDTERSWNRLRIAAGIAGYFTGGETNWQRNVDEYIDHVRSIPGSKMYGSPYYEKAKLWMETAKGEALQRVIDWQIPYVPTVSIITTCKGRLEHLQQSLKTLVRQQVSQHGLNFDCEIVVVDYGCPDIAADWVDKQYIDGVVKTVRVVSNTEQFNQSRARNAGAMSASGDILIFVDADMLLPDGFANRIVSIMQTEKVDLVCPSSNGDTYGTCAMTRAVFIEMRGYDESFTDYGGEDSDMYFRIVKAGLRQHKLEDNGLQHLQHSEESRTRFYNEKDREKSGWNNHKRMVDLNRVVNPDGIGSL